jgi:hypothetical protein
MPYLIQFLGVFLHFATKTLPISIEISHLKRLGSRYFDNMRLLLVILPFTLIQPLSYIQVSI